MAGTRRVRAEEWIGEVGAGRDRRPSLLDVLWLGVPEQ